MLFAHGPLGALIAGCFWKETSKRKLIGYLVMGFIGGIFPDVDLFYFYLVNAENSHRTFFTHTLLIPAIIFLNAAMFHFVGKKKMCNFLFILVLAYLSHLFTDMLGSQVMLFYPFSRSFFGLADLNITLINTNLIVVNFLLEGVIFFFFFYALVRFFVLSVVKRLIAVFFLLTGLTLWTAFFLLLNSHIYHSPADTYYGDYDNDDILNYDDEDIDGDGLTNFVDTDADGDGKINELEIMQEAEKFVGVWYDFTEGGWIQIPMRLGLVSNADLPRRIYESIGISLRLEMTEDYNKNSEGYGSSPRVARFAYESANVASWLRHQNKFEQGENLEKGRNQIGDILFLESGYVAVVTGFTNNLRTVVLDVQQSRRIQELPLEQVMAWEGNVVGRGKVLP